MGKVLIAAVAGAVIVFAWGAVSWMLLPFHEATINVFADEDTVGAVLKENVSRTGIYMLPGHGGSPKPTDAQAQKQLEKEVRKKFERGPYFFGIVRPGAGGASMGVSMLGSLAINLVAALILAALMTLVRDDHYPRRVFLAVGVGLFVAVSGHLPYWNWFHFPLDYTLLYMADMVAQWTLAGLVMAKILTPPPKERFADA